ncbi:hypothetical protein GCM10009834_12460 [Streptomonospora arabica]
MDNRADTISTSCASWGAAPKLWKTRERQPTVPARLPERRPQPVCTCCNPTDLRIVDNSTLVDRV